MSPYTAPASGFILLSFLWLLFQFATLNFAIFVYYQTPHEFSAVALVSNNHAIRRWFLRIWSHSRFFPVLICGESFSVDCRVSVSCVCVIQGQWDAHRGRDARVSPLHMSLVWHEYVLTCILLFFPFRFWRPGLNYCGFLQSGNAKITSRSGAVFFEDLWRFMIFFNWELGVLTPAPQ